MTAGGLRHPEWAPVVAVLVALATAIVAAGGARARRRLARLVGGRASVRGAGRDAALVVALAALGLAALGPRLGERVERTPASGVDVVLLVDVSRSMEARDVPPDRLRRAQRAAVDVLERLGPGDRAALAAFAGRGVLLTPLTPDLDALAEMAPALDTDLMQGRGSQLGDGVRAALEAFEAGSARPRLLLVLSDGEAPAGEAASDVGADAAARAGARVLAVALGSEAGGVVPDHGVPLLDARGRAVVSRPDAARLGALAAATGGELVATDAFGAIDPEATVRALRRDATGAPGAVVERRVPAERVAPFAALSFLLLALESAWPLGRGRRLPARRGPWRTARVTAAGFTLALAPAAPAEAPEAPLETEPLAELEARVATRPQDPDLLVRVGLARVREGLPADAAKAFLAGALYARDPALASLAFYDQGVACLAGDDLPAARDAFFDALALAPGDRRAQFNLEWTLRALAERPPAASDTQGSRPDDADGGDAEAGSDDAGGQGAGGAEDARGREQGAPEPGAPGAEDAREEAGEGPASGAPATGEAGGAAGAATGGRIPELTPAEAQRWLAGVSEDPGRALRETARRATAGAPATGSGAAGKPTW